MITATTEDLDARLASLLARRPDLAAAVNLQRSLLGRMIALVDHLQARARSAATPALHLTAASRLKQGLPALRCGGVVMPIELLGPELVPVSDALADGGAADSARHISEAFRSGRIDPESLLDASFRRDQVAVRTFANHASLSADLLWLVGELAVGPFAFCLQVVVFDDETARATLAAWDRGYCPACGSWPAMAELTAGARHLRCSFCASGWQPPVCRCVYCAEEGPAFSLAAPDEECPGWRLELCAACGGYLKSIEAAAPSRYPLLAVDDMETSPLDVAAMNRGYLRPPLREFGAALSAGPARCRAADA